MYFRLLALALILVWRAPHAEGFVIVTFNDQIQPLRTNQVKMLYRGRVNHLEGIAVKLADLPNSSSIRKDFYQALLNKTPSQMNMIWARQSFSGQSSAPYELENDTITDVIDWLTENPNGVAYLPETGLPPGINVLYKLHN